MIESIKKQIAGRAVKAFAVQKERLGLNVALDEYMEAFGVTPRYLMKEKQEDIFLKMRHTLETMPALVISNHPQIFDLPILLKALEKRITKTKALVDINFLDVVSELFGKEFAVPALRYTGESNPLVEKAVGHIEKEKGIFLMFPAGGTEYRSGNLEFKNSFRGIIDKLQPDTIVYSFFISQDDIAQFLNSYKKLIKFAIRAVSEFLLPMPRKLKVDMLKRTIRVDERIHTAEFWKRALSDSERKVVNQALTRIYLDDFGIDQSAFSQTYLV